MRRALCLGLVIAALAASPATATTTALRIVLWPQGRDAPERKTWTLRCGPAGGTLPKPSAACRKLALLVDPFAPISPDTICTQTFGGPAVAVVSGTFRGRRIWATFRRTDSCQIDRWNRIGFLFP